MPSGDLKALSSLQAFSLEVVLDLSEAKLVLRLRLHSEIYSNFALPIEKRILEKSSNFHRNVMRHVFEVSSSCHRMIILNRSLVEIFLQIFL
jgi:hypothetical protein